MAVYKVPQDVEADDKLIGPFSFRQFIYLLIVAAAGFIGWVLSQLFIPLAIIVLPVIIFFGALALPLRKDQPMETYLAAIVSFYLKPHRRLWDPDGIQSLVEITVPKVIEVQRAKDLTEDEAERRLSYLASIVDSRGWAVRGVQSQTPSAPSSMNSDAYYEAQTAQDVLDDTSGVGQAFETRLDQADAKRHQEMVQRMQAQVAAPAPVVQQPIQQQAPVAPQMPYIAPPQSQPTTPDPHLSFNPYPAMHQSLIAPIDPNATKANPAPEPTIAPKAQPEPEKPSEKPLSPDIINLANNPDLSVETIAREANRIHEKEKLSDDEVVISLR